MMAGCMVRALYDFNGSNIGELSFVKGDVIIVTQETNRDWYEGTIESRKGLFPVSYTEKLDLSTCRIVTAKQDYVSNDERELSFFKGDRIRILSDLNRHWLHGELNGKVGILPSLYVSDVSDTSEYDQVAHELNNALNQQLPCAQANYDFEGRHQSELSFPKDSIIILLKDVDNDWFEGSFNKRTGYFPKSYVTVLIPFPERNTELAMPCARAIYPFVGEKETELTFKEGDLILLRKRAGSQWMEGELDGRIGLFPASFVEVEIELNEEQFVTDDKVAETQAHTKHNATFAAVKKKEWKTNDKARALYHFTAMHQGDIELNEGDVLDIIRVEDEHWVEARNENGTAGMCPLAYLEPIGTEHSLSKERKAPENLFHCAGTSCVDRTNGKLQNGVTMNDSNDNNNGNYKCDKTLKNSQMRISRSVLDSSFDEDSTVVLQPTETRTFACVSDSNINSEQWVSHQVSQDSSDSFSKYSKSNRERGLVSPTSPSAIYAQPFKKSSKFSPVKFIVPGSDNSKGKQDAQSSHFVFENVSLEEKTANNMQTNTKEVVLLDSEHRYDDVPVYKSSHSNSRKEHDKKIFNSQELQFQISKNTEMLFQNQQGTVKNETEVSSSFGPIFALPNKNKFSLNERTSFPSFSSSSSTSSTESNADSACEKQFSQKPFSKPSVVRYLGSDSTHSSKKKISLLDDNIFGTCSSSKLTATPLVPLPSVRSYKTEGISSTTTEYNNSPAAVKRRAPPVPYKPTSRPRTKSANIQLLKNNEAPPTPMIQTSPIETSSLSPTRHTDTQQSEFKSATLPRSMKPKLFVSERRKSLSSEEENLTSDGPSNNSQIACSGDTVLWQRSATSTASQELFNGDSKIAVEVPEKKGNIEDILNGEINLDDVNLNEIPQVPKLDEKIAEAETKLQREKNIFTGMEIIMQMIGADVEKQKDIDPRMAASKLKIKGWQDELSALREQRQFVIERHVKRKVLEDKIADFELELERQVNNQKSLKVLLSVVEESRKQEVLDNLRVCADIIEEISGDLKQLEESLHGLNRKLPTSQQQMAEQRQKVVDELISTEKVYLQDLQLCVKYFFHELKKQKNKNIDCDTLFGNMEEVVELSSKLLSSFEEAVDGKESSEQELGKCFVAVSEEMKIVYAHYCKNHDDATALMEKYEEDFEVQNAFKKCMETMREHTKCWDLSSFLIKPVQRVLKYPLLLNELLKYTPEIHKDKYNLIKAIDAMTDVAAAINEVKRRKDLVVKYKRAEESGITKKVQKLSWHSVIKKSSRINQKITQLTGLVSQTVDEKFIEEEKKLNNMEKMVKNLTKNISIFLEQFQETTSFSLGTSENIREFYSDAATCTEVSLYHSAQKRIMESRSDSFMRQVQMQVMDPLNSILSLFQGPQRLIQKRHHKCLDYDSLANKIDKIKDRDKLKSAKEELELAKKTYEALNSQLLEDLPCFRDMTAHLVKQSLLRLAISQRNFLAEVLAEYNLLTEMSIVQNQEGDIVEQHAKRLAVVVDRFATISFMPCSFIPKDTSKKKRRSTYQTPSLSSDSQLEDKELETAGQGASPATVMGNLKKKRPAPTPPMEPTQSHPPEPKPRRRTSDTSNQNFSVASKSDLVGVTPAEDRKRYLARFAFEAQNIGELSLRKGDHVTVLRHSDTSGNPEWWLVESRGTTGYVPGSFLTLFDTEPSAVSKAEQLTPELPEIHSEEQPFKPISNNSEVERLNTKEVLLQYYAEWSFESSGSSELSLEQGQVVIVRRQQDLEGNPEWWLVEAGGAKGYVPASYLSPIINED